MAVVVMMLTALGMILMVRFGLCPGINQVALARNWSVKVRGQATGFATSVPELVCLVATGLSGVWQAGLWNIASSNIINWLFMWAAVWRYHKSRDLINKRFIDEIGFAVLAVAVPIALMQAGMDRHWAVIPVLAVFFVVYRWVDRKVNIETAAAGKPAEDRPAAGRLGKGLGTIVLSLIVIMIVGKFLGDAAEQVVSQLNVPAAGAGWILGLVTSLPEMTTFFMVYASARKSAALAKLEDTQEALDNLTFSNMSNVGLIYPLGLAIFLIVTALRS